MDASNKRTNSDKVALFRSCFSGLSEVYGTYDLKTGQARQVKEPVTNEVLLAHLTGKQSYGVYLLVKDRTRAIAVDFDTKDRTAPSDFVTRAKHYGLSSYIECSKSKGYHVWIFFDEIGVPALKARLVVQYILEEIEQPQIEIFPKQDQLGGDMRYGNFINAPLFGSRVLEGKTAFVEPAEFSPYPDQWGFLESVNRMTEEILDEVIEMNELSPKQALQSSEHSSKKTSEGTFGLPPCAVRMLRDGVSQFQRVGCFRLAVHLKRLGLPYDVAVAALNTWALKNRPVNGKGVIRDKELLSQVSYAYDHAYSGYGCNSAAIEPFCEVSCPVRQWKESKKHISSEEDPRALIQSNGRKHSSSQKGIVMEEYLTTVELSERIKMAPGTIRNLVWKNELKKNVHYLKPTSRKLLFVWSEVQQWLYGNSGGYSKSDNLPNGLINI